MSASDALVSTNKAEIEDYVLSYDMKVLLYNMGIVRLRNGALFWSLTDCIYIKCTSSLTILR